jgi:hypothetical protein
MIYSEEKNVVMWARSEMSDCAGNEQAQYLSVSIWDFRLQSSVTDFYLCGVLFPTRLIWTMNLTGNKKYEECAK